MKRRARLLGWLFRWHRRIGVLAALFVIAIAASGVLLNHTVDLQLDRQLVRQDWLYAYYGDQSTEQRAYQVAEHWWYRAESGNLYRDGQPLSRCVGALRGVALAGEQLYVACAQELLLFTARGELIETVGASGGLPVPIDGIGLAAGDPMVLHQERWWRVDMDRLDFTGSAPAGVLVEQVMPGRLPAALVVAIPDAQRWLTWERVLLDLHSGRLFGVGGVLWVDLVACILCLLALSGVGMWSLHRHRR